MTSALITGLIALGSSVLKIFCQTSCWIQDKYDAHIEGMVLHVYQEKILEIQDWCEANGIPCRIVGLKPRRGGSSTIAMASMYHRLMKSVRRGCVMGGREFQCDNLFKMLRLMATKDRTVTTKAIVLDKEARFPNGSYCTRINAASDDAGLSGGFTFMVITELAKWATEGVAAAAPVLAGALKCVPFLPGTTIIIESTAEGVGDEFHRIYSTGISFEELKAGKVGFVKVFSPWFEFRDAVLEPSQMGIQSESDLTPEEVELKAKYGLSLANISWMRYTIKDQCFGNFDNFRENYPFDDVDCFLLTGRKVFSAAGLKKMKEDVAKFIPAMGVLDFVKSDTKSVIWRGANAGDCRILRWEQPQEGRRYGVIVDPMTGASNTSGDDTDNHSIQVWRAGYHERGQWVPRKLVAQVVDDWELWLRDRKYVLKWDIPLLEEYVWKVMCYYQAILIPEMNMERGMVELIKLRGGDIIIQQIPNRVEQTTSNRYGVYTYGGANGGARGGYISELARGIREYANVDPIKGWSRDRCEIYSPIVLDECETFIKLLSGREEAMQKKKDDNVLCAAIAVSHEDAFTTYQRKGGTSHLDTEGDDDSRIKKDGTYR